MNNRRRVVILGAAGRDFHNFNVVYRGDPDTEVVAFTASQIPFIERRSYPSELAGPLYPEGIPIHPEEDLPGILVRHAVQEVVFAYSDVSYEHVMRRSAVALSAGADFSILGPGRTAIPSRRPVLSVCAVRTGSGKSAVARYAAKVLRSLGRRVAVLRHPMPYGDLLSERCQRFETAEDLAASRCTVEEREEYEPLVAAGIVVYAGVDYGEILSRAEGEADVIVWDGGNNDLPLIRPDLEIVVADPHRLGHETTYHPGEANLRRAHAVVLNKVDTASPEAVATLEETVRRVNPGAKILRLASPITVDRPEMVRGKRVLAVEDGPTLTHGGMGFGAATLAARKFGAAELVDPRPFARGTIRAAFASYPHIGACLPALGYSPEQLDELGEAIEGTPCDVVLLGTPADLTRVLKLTREVVRASYEVEELAGAPLKALVEAFSTGGKERPWAL